MTKICDVTSSNRNSNATIATAATTTTTTTTTTNYYYYCYYWTGALGAQSVCVASARGGLDGSTGREHSEHSEHKAFVLQVLVTEREHWTGALHEQLWAS